MRTGVWIPLVALLAIASQSAVSYGQLGWLGQGQQSAAPQGYYVPQQPAIPHAAMPQPPGAVSQAPLALMATAPQPQVAQVPQVPAGVTPQMVLMAARQNPAAACGSADTGAGCGIGGCGGGSCCGLPRVIVYGDFLYIRPRDADVAYGVPFNGAATPPGMTPIQTGPVGVVDPEWEPTFRVGFGAAIGDCAMVGASYMKYESTTSDAITTTAPYVIRSLVVHPSTLNVASDGLDASAQLGLDFNVVDLEIRRVFSWSELHTINWVAGARYADLTQDFDSIFAINGSETVSSDVTFNGAGIRLGLEGERYGRCWGLVMYGRANVSFLAGEFSADYFQRNSFSGTNIVATNWTTQRAITIADIEFGAGWTSPGGRLRITGGYMFSSWYNLVKVDEFIGAVQTNNFSDISDSLTFDGAVVRVEGRF
jgi:hypothetical protein